MGNNKVSDCAENLHSHRPRTDALLYKWQQFLAKLNTKIKELLLRFIYACLHSIVLHIKLLNHTVAGIVGIKSHLLSLPHLV